MSAGVLSATSSSVVADPIRVLFADDSAAIRTLARFALPTRLGFSVVAEASDGAQALELYDVHLPDCVVLDVDMPGMNGFDALAELHRRSPQVPVVMLSGFTDEQSVERALRAGAAAYLAKGTQLTELGETIRRVIAAGRALDPPLTAPAPRDAAAPVRADADAGPSRAEVRRFEYVVSHDLAEPVRIMAGFATLLQTRYATAFDDSGRSFLAHIVSASVRLQTMIDDLVTYSRAGNLSPRITPVRLDATVARVSDELGARLRECGAKVVVSDLPVALCDAEMIATVLRHLVVNAITFTTAEPPVVHVAGSVVGGVATVTIADNGVGMDPGRCEDVFDLFQRLNTREEYPGTGTGLALCRRLVGLQGGTLTLTSAPGRGTTATLTLPAPTDYLGETS